MKWPASICRWSRSSRRSSICRSLRSPAIIARARLLRDAVRLGFRSSAGPFRSFARIAVEPRPYQLVPLLMALKLDPVRLLIADDVGIGKTIEAGLIARELLDRGEVERLAVLCPPQLAEQWQAELHDKFHIDAELVLPGTATRLERNCRVGQSLFDLYPFVIVSTDFIKSDRRRDEFLRTCPELVIVDEAHTCAYGGEGRGGAASAASTGRRAGRESEATSDPGDGHPAQRQRSRVSLAADVAESRLCRTARRSDRQRERAPSAQVGGAVRAAQARRHPALPGRRTRRSPTREGGDVEETYKLSPDYKRLFERVLKYAREIVQRSGGRQSASTARALVVGAGPAALAGVQPGGCRRDPAHTGRQARTPKRSPRRMRSGGAACSTSSTTNRRKASICRRARTTTRAMSEQGNRRRLLEMAREAEALARRQGRRSCRRPSRWSRV